MKNLDFPRCFIEKHGISDFQKPEKSSSSLLSNREKDDYKIKTTILLPEKNEKRKPLSYDFLIYMYSIQQNKVKIYYPIMSSTNR